MGRRHHHARTPQWALMVAAVLASACGGADASTDATATIVASTTPPAPTTAPTTTTRATSVATSAHPPTSTTAAPGTTASVPTGTVATTDATTTTGAPASTTTAPAAPRSVSFAFTGDSLWHSPLWRRAERNAAAAGTAGFDFDPMLAGLAPVLGAVDLAVCHLETPIAPLGEEHTTFPYFGVPVEVLDATVAAGFDRCSTASNHALDRGPAGVERTVTALLERGLSQAGMARTPAEIEPTVVDVAGVAVGHLSYTWSYNGLQPPDGEPWRSALIDPDRIVADVAAARSDGAEIVVVSLHWGAEGVHEPTGYQRDLADELTRRADIDLIVGHHAHVVQPIEQVNGTWVMFGLGNIISNLPTSDRWPASSRDGVVVVATATIDEAGRVSWATPVARPTWVDHDAGWVVVDVLAELADDDLPAGRRGVLERSLERTTTHLGDAEIDAEIPTALRSS